MYLPAGLTMKLVCFLAGTFSVHTLVDASRSHCHAQVGSGDPLSPALEELCQTYITQAVCATTSGKHPTSSATCAWRPVVLQTWGALASAVAELPKSPAAPKKALIDLGSGFTMAGYNGTAITLPEGYVVSIVGAPGGIVLNAGSKGSLFIAEGSLVLEGLAFSHGAALAKGSNGGVISVNSGGSAAFTRCSFAHNAAPYGDGGVAHVHSNASATFTSCAFANNTASAGGGAVDVYKGSARFVDCTFAEDSAGTELRYNGIYVGGSVIFGCPAGTTGPDVPLTGNANTSQLPPAEKIVVCH